MTDYGRTVVLDGERLRREREHRGLSINGVMDLIAEKGFLEEISEATYRRAESGHPVFVKTARNIATVLDIPFEELVLRSDIRAMLGELEDFLGNAKSIIKTWLKEGYDGADGKLPAHPEFMFRLSGEWKGWNVFLDVTPDGPEWKENRYCDIFEEAAFRILEVDGGTRSAQPALK